MKDSLMDESRTRNFTQSGTGLIEIDGVAVHARWRMTGIQDYKVGAGAAQDGLRKEIAVSLFFDKLADEAEQVQLLLEKVQADKTRELECKLPRATAAVYFQEIRAGQSGDPVGVIFGNKPRN
ncbi:MAG TPA: hypothetical protein VHC19_15840 [Pirellulales bacterium]|nr:hypothetical protein [Pirellulales bacterium]